jgi:hypothetical protein
MIHLLQAVDEKEFAAPSFIGFVSLDLMFLLS